MIEDEEVVVSVFQRVASTELLQSLGSAAYELTKSFFEQIGLEVLAS